MMAGKSIAIVRGPGGLPGIDVHAGAWAALEDMGIEGTRLYGCSAGAVVSAMNAAGDLNGFEFADFIDGLDDEDVLHKRPWWWLQAFWLDHFVDPSPIRGLLADHLPPATMRAPGEVLGIAVTEMDDAGLEPGHVLENPTDLRGAVMASMSIAGVFPYTRVDGVWYSDGGTSNALPIPADWARLDLLVVLNPVRRESYARRDRNMISRLLWNVERLSRGDATRERGMFAGAENVLWVDLDMGDHSTLEFDHRLIGRAYDDTAAAVEAYMTAHPALREA